MLKGVSVHIEPGSKVGIVGRTGAGKSTFTTALMRLYDGEGGRILIDGVDIYSIGVNDLRRNIEIIPQVRLLPSHTLDDASATAHTQAARPQLTTGPDAVHGLSARQP